jgi:hypothetical protein
LEAQFGGDGQVCGQLVEALGDRHTVDGVNPLKMLEGLFGFVALEVADQVPSDSRQILERLLFGNCFLDPTFAKISNSGPVSFSHQIDWDSLADCDNPNGGWHDAA